MARVILVLIFLCSTVPAQDSIGDQQTDDKIAQRDPNATVWLSSSSGKFAGLFFGAIPSARRGGIILIHGPDSPADASSILGPIMRQLPEHGWDTLTIEIPLPESAASPDAPLQTLPQSLDRIAAAVNFLAEREAEPMALIGYSEGTLSVVRFLTQTSGPKPAAAVVIDPPTAPVLASALLGDLTKITMPLLDIFSNRARSLTSDYDLERKRAQRQNPDYRQVMLLDTSTGYEAMKEMLTNHISGWLIRQTKPKEPLSDTVKLKDGPKS